MKLLITISFVTLAAAVLAQSSKQNVALNDRAIKSSQQYFDVNDPYFLAFFINAQKGGDKKRMFDSLVKKSSYYNSIAQNEMEFFIDSIKELVFRDTGKVCISTEISVKSKNVVLPQSSYIFWVNDKYFYKVGYHPKNTKEFVDEFLVLQKIKSISVIVPPKNTSNCIGKTLAHIYIYTKRRSKINYDVASLKHKQLKIGRKWIGHN